jgi:leucyl aminopeptidase
MSDALKLGFSTPVAPTKGVLVLFCEAGLKLGPSAKKVLAPAGDLLTRAATADRFTGKAGSALDLVAPAGLKVSRLIVIGTGRSDAKSAEGKPESLLKLGGQAIGRVPRSAAEVTVLAEWADGSMKPDQAADLALGMTLRAYAFDRYKTRRKEGEEEPKARKVTIGVGDPGKARKAWASRAAVAGGVVLARDLVNEPANVLHPGEFARRASTLRKLGVKVDIFDERAMAKLEMRALLGVGQGSAHGGRMVVMRWNGGRKGDAPVAFIGKGVCFDTGGVSIKPAAGMEDMKGDMGGAACVVGLMHALAARKARVNAVGLIGIVENMLDGKAQRPGDIVTSMSGQTIEIINTDAEGRLVLADVLCYAKRFKPKFMIDLATLTGAIIISLGQEHAGLFANDDKLAERLSKAGEETGEKVWRMPLGPEYDKLIDSKFADMKNTGGRYGGAITAAQFLQRFVEKDTPWAHLDIAGTAMGSPQTDTNRSWGSGYGVRLLNRLVADHYEG